VRGIARLAEKLLASQETLYSKHLVCYLEQSGVLNNVIDFMVTHLRSVYPFFCTVSSWFQWLTKLYHAADTADSYRTAACYVIGSARTAAKRIMSCKAPHSPIEHVYSASYCKLSFHFIHVKKKSWFSEITEFGVARNWELFEQEQADRCMYQQVMLVIQDGVTKIFCTGQCNTCKTYTSIILEIVTTRMYIWYMSFDIRGTTTFW